MPSPELQQPAADVWNLALRLPCMLTVEVPVPRFTVRDLLRLQSGQVLNTAWAQSADVGVRVNDELIAWAEFEVVNEHLAARITELR